MYRNARTTAALITLIMIAGIGFSQTTSEFTATPQEGEGPLKVNLDASLSQSAENRSIDSYSWDLDGDGTWDKEGKVINNTYFQLGTHNTTLKVTDTEGAEDLSTKQIKVFEPIESRSLSVKAEDAGDGYVYLEALAGYYLDGTFTCRNTSVEAKLSSFSYELKEPEDKTHCKFSKQVNVGPGDYNAEFTGTYPNGTETETSQVTVKGEEPKINIYTPSQDSQHSLGNSIYIEVGAERNGRLIQGDFKAYLNETQLDLSKTGINTYSGRIDPLTTGEKQLKITFEDDSWNLSKNVSIEIVEQGEVEGSRSLDILYPKEGMMIDKNEVTAIEVELKNENGLNINDQEINYVFTRYGNTTSQGTIEQQDSLYTKIHNFTEPGEYNLKVEWEGLEESVNITVGPEEEIPESKKLQIDMVTPKATAYSDEADISVIAIVSKMDELIEEASVYYILDSGEEVPIDSTRPGEYGGNLGTLDQGRHTLTVKAEYDGEVAIDTTPFEVTGRYLEVETINPSHDEFVNITKGERVEMEVNVTDQNGVIAANSLVTATLTSPSGKESELIMKQDKEKGTYAADYYPDESGQYTLEVKAEKSDHVAGEDTSNIEIQANREKTDVETFIGDLDLRFLLKIAMILAIIILLLAIFTRII